MQTALKPQTNYVFVEMDARVWIMLIVQLLFISQHVKFSCFDCFRGIVTSAGLLGTTHLIPYTIFHLKILFKSGSPYVKTICFIKLDSSTPSLYGLISSSETPCFAVVSDILETVQYILFHLLSPD